MRGTLPKAAGALLTIVPQGPLLNVSFAALQSPQGRYLLEDYTLHYAPAGAVLQYTEPKKRSDARTGQMLLVADPAPPRCPRSIVHCRGCRERAARRRPSRGCCQPSGSRCCRTPPPPKHGRAAA